MPNSPICTVNSTSTLNGVDVAASSTVTVQLADTAGVTVWTIVCVNTDELLSAATITAALTVDYVGKTATFTAPAAGSALIFKSVINNGVDRNGVIQPSYTTTFGVFVPTVTGYRTGAFDERLEGSAGFGWVSKFNPLIRGVVSTASGNAVLCAVGAGPLANGVGVIGIGNATTVPTSNPTGGGCLYVHAGALYFRGSAGTVTPIAPA